jgi:hypothetical protein
MQDSWWTRERWNRSLFRVLRFCLIDISPPVVYTRLYLHTTLTTTSRRILEIFKQSVFYRISKKHCREWKCHTVFSGCGLQISLRGLHVFCNLNWNRKVEHIIIKKGSNELISAYFGYSVWCCNNDKCRPNMPWRHRRVAEVYLSFLTSALDGSMWSTPRSVRFTTLQETLYPLYGRLGGPRSQSGWQQRDNSLPAPELEPRTFWPIVSRYIH